MRAAAFVVLAGCFEDAPPPVVEATSDGSATVGADGSTMGAATTSTATSPSSGPASTSGELESSDVDSVADASSTASEAMCGDEVVDDSEMCDSTPGCDATCEFTDYACNPLNDAGCESPQRCGLVDFVSETFACMPAGPGGIGAACGRSAANDGDCDVGLTCLFNGQTALCDVGACCVRYCDTLSGTGCDDLEYCAMFFPRPMYLGLEHLGYCYSR